MIGGKHMVYKNFQSKNDIISYIDAGLGSEGSHELAEKIYDHLHAVGKVDFCGLTEIPENLWDYVFANNLL